MFNYVPRNKLENRDRFLSNWNKKFRTFLTFYFHSLPTLQFKNFLSPQDTYLLQVSIDC